MKVFRKFIFSITLASLMAVPTVTSYASSELSLEITDEYIKQFGITTTDENGNDVIELPVSIDHFITEAGPIKPTEEHVDEEISPYHVHVLPHSHSIRNISSMQINTFKPLTEWTTGSSVGIQRGKSFSIDSSISGNVTVGKDVVSTSLGTSVGTSSSVTSSTTYNFNIPSGYKGRVIYRYSYYYYTFDFVTKWTLTGKEDIVRGNASSSPIGGVSSYYTVQLVQR